MKNMLAAAAAALALGCWSSAPAQTEITLVGPGGVRAAVEQLIPGFEKKTGYKVKATFGSGLGTKKQVAQGEPFDVPISSLPTPKCWLRETWWPQALRRSPALR